ncbi:MAG TPA: PRC-barrel domain-containing protein [Chloroflexota bacterium]|nr:PRC-barrel domain-containing protein [Chloroflexota bacterium]
MESIGTAQIRRLSDSKLTVKHPDEDVRGRKVLDKAGEDIGTVDDLFIGDRESKVRFLRVEAGGVLGIGAKVVLIPVDAITQVTATAVHIDRSREHVAGGPGTCIPCSRGIRWEFFLVGTENDPRTGLAANR